MDAILNRRSIRRYKNIKVSDELIQELLKAGMAAPSAGNQQPWQFIILRDKDILKKITEVHQYSQMLLNSDVAIVVCGDESKEVFKGFWVQDCSASTENILIAAQAKGLGTVWLGIYPEADRVQAIKEILGLPASVIPLSIIPIGYPDEEKSPSDRFDKTRIHYDRW